MNSPTPRFQTQGLWLSRVKAETFRLWRGVVVSVKPKPYNRDFDFLQEEWEAGRHSVMVTMLLGAVIFVVRGSLRVFTGVLPTDLVWVEASWRAFISFVLLYIVWALRKKISFATAQRFMVWYVFFLIVGLVVAVIISPNRSAYTLFPITLICLMATALWLQGRQLIWSLAVALVPVLWLVHSGIMSQVDASNYNFYIPLSIVLGVVLRHGRLKTAHDAYKLRQQLADKAHNDVLTGLLNRAGWELNTAKSLERPEGSYHSRHSLLYLDLDYFKRVNDTLGHPVGDELLRMLARVMQQQMREQDVLARFGGEEFVMLLPHTSSSQALGVAERIRVAVSENTQPTEVTVSIGVAELSSLGDLEEALHRADMALLQAKQQGRNQVVLSP